jgi:hypothetical protein
VKEFPSGTQKKTEMHRVETILQDDHHSFSHDCHAMIIMAVMRRSYSA